MAFTEVEKLPGFSCKRQIHLTFENVDVNILT